VQDPQQGHEAPAAGLALQSIWRAFLFAEACAVADVAGDILTRILAGRLHLNRLLEPIKMCLREFDVTSGMHTPICYTFSAPRQILTKRVQTGFCPCCRRTRRTSAK